MHTAHRDHAQWQSHSIYHINIDKSSLLYILYDKLSYSILKRVVSLSVDVRNQWVGKRSKKHIKT
jgi:hypothetical protein